MHTMSLLRHRHHVATMADHVVFFLQTIFAANKSGTSNMGLMLCFVLLHENTTTINAVTCCRMCCTLNAAMLDTVRDAPSWSEVILAGHVPEGGDEKTERLSRSYSGDVQR